jgi:uncharacterized membrane protein YhaH (DUF805 family)
MTNPDQRVTPPILTPSTTAPDNSAKLQPLDILFSYKGRISRGQYWGFGVLVWLGALVVATVATNSSPESLNGVSLLLVVGGLWIGTAMGTKRMHDQNKSGATMVVLLIPLIGGIIWLVLTLIASDAAPNQYGPAAGHRYG